MRIYLTTEVEPIRSELSYVFRVLGINKKIDFEFSNSGDDALSVGVFASARLQVCQNFVDGRLSKAHLGPSSVFQNENGSPDFLGTAFFMLSSLQEFNDTDPDDVGRFKYRNSYQYAFGNVKENVVQRCFDEIAEKIGIKTPDEKTKFFLSHDIDDVYGAILEDGFNVLKKGRVDQFLGLLLNAVAGKPDWLNIDKILKIESEYDVKSTFFWIVNKGKVNKREANADYKFNSQKIQDNFKKIEKVGFENGIHKSISKENFREEFVKYGNVPLANRYHYLKFNLPGGFDAIEESGIKMDASLGFAEEIGFRNSYGLPYNPYNFKKKLPYTFVEIPLHVMDRTFFQYKKSSVVNAKKEVIDFFEKNKSNCVLSVLWHNNFFTEFKFKGYLDLYKTILIYIKENNFEVVSQKQIIKTYSINK